MPKPTARLASRCRSENAETARAGHTAPCAKIEQWADQLVNGSRKTLDTRPKSLSLANKNFWWSDARSFLCSGDVATP